MSETSKVLLIAGQYPPQIGDLARAAQRNARFISDEYQVTVINLTDALEPGKLAREAPDKERKNIEIYRLGIAKRVPVTLRLAANLIEDLHNEYNFDLIVGFYLVYAGYLAAYYGRRFNLPSLVSVRGNDLDTALFTSEHLPFVEWTLKNASLIGCVTRDLAAHAVALSGRNDIRYMPNSVDCDIWQPLLRDETLAAELGLRDQIVVGFVGELREKKAPAALVDAFVMLHSNLPSKLLLIGGARKDEREKLDQFVCAHPRLRSDLHLIEYVDSQDQLRRYYSLIDIALFPSLWEGMSNAVLEAMAMERVVFASAVGGNSEIIEDNNSGFLIARNRLGELGRQLLSISLNKPEQLQAIASSARKRVMEHFSPQQEKRNLLESITELLRDRMIKC